MLDKEMFEATITNIKGSINETDSALVSEDMLNIVSSYNGLYDENQNNLSKIKALEEEKTNLIKVNGKLFQKIGFENDKPEKSPLPEKEEVVIDINDIIDKKGGMIK